MSVSELLRAMQLLGVNQTELAARLQLSARTVRRYLAGDARIPRVVVYALKHLQAELCNCDASAANRAIGNHFGECPLR